LAYESACLYQAFGVKYEGNPELARRLRDRWVSEAATQVDIRTTTKPYRHE
jgi:NADH:ubiquinone oxidoreductase subunit C